MWPDWVSNPGPLALETDAARLVAAGMGVGGGWAEVEGCRNKVERCTV